MSGTKFWPFAAFLRKLPFWQSPAKHNFHGLPFDVTGWTVRGYLDVLSSPIMVIAGPDGRELALDYSTGAKREVPIEWARALGVEIDSARFDGVMLAARFRKHTPIVSIGADGSAVIVTAKGALTHRAGSTPRWRRGFHIPLSEYRQFRRAGPELARRLIADSQFDFPAWAKQTAKAAVDSLNGAVMERHGGIDADDLHGFPRHGYTDSTIAESKRLAREAIARAAQ